MSGVKRQGDLGGIPGQGRANKETVLMFIEAQKSIKHVEVYHPGCLG